MRRRRRRSMAGALGPLRRSLGKQSRIPMEKRRHYGEALGLTKLTFNCAIWPPLQETVMQRFAQAYLSVYRTALQRPRSNNSEDHDTNTQILVEVDRVSPQVYLTLARLRYLPRLLAKAPDPLLASYCTPLPVSSFKFSTRISVWVLVFCLLP